MNLMLFLGFGVSGASGLPGVPKIRDALFNAPGQEPRIQKFLKLLEHLDGSYLTSSAPYKTKNEYAYSGQIFRTMTTYEDLFYLSSQITLSGWGLLGDATAGSFTELVRSKGQSFLKGRTKIAQTVDLEELASRTCQYIEKTVADLLHSDTVRGLDLILNIVSMGGIDRLYIVTLNHDSLIEQLLIEHGIAYADGFSPPDGDIRWYTDQFFEADKVAVIKPHGSVTWFRSGDYRIVQPVVPTDRHLETWADGQGNPLPHVRSTPSFLTGASKVSLYNRGIFANMLFQFQAALRDCARIVMSGYGWGDTPINFHLEYWLGRSPKNKLIILHEKPRSLMDRSKELSEMSRSYLQSGRIVGIEKWLAHASLDDLAPYLVD